MARPTKEGLDYFPLYVDIFEDEKIVRPISNNRASKGERRNYDRTCSFVDGRYLVF